MRTRHLAALLALIVLNGGVASALDPSIKCETDKLKTAGKYSFCRMKAEAKATKKGEAPDFSKCVQKLHDKWQSIETKTAEKGGTCPVSGDTATAEAKIDADSAGLAALLRGQVAKTVFVTNATYHGALGGIAGADAKCQNAASAAGLSGTYLAWVATGPADDPESRFAQSPYGYRLVDGTSVANSWGDLVDTSLSSSISLSETGATLSRQVWTGVLDDGTASGSGTNCLGWTNNDEILGACTEDALVGRSDLSNSSWTEFTVLTADGCCTNKSLYCFQQ